LLGGGRVLVESLISNKGAKIKERENLYGVIKQEGKLGFLFYTSKYQDQRFLHKIIAPS
jgi:hypothetical protein